VSKTAAIKDSIGEVSEPEELLIKLQVQNAMRQSEQKLSQESDMTKPPSIPQPTASASLHGSAVGSVAGPRGSQKEAMQKLAQGPLAIPQRPESDHCASTVDQTCLEDSDGTFKAVALKTSNEAMRQCEEHLNNKSVFAVPARPLGAPSSIDSAGDIDGESEADVSAKSVAGEALDKICSRVPKQESDVKIDISRKSDSTSNKLPVALQGPIKIEARAPSDHSAVTIDQQFIDDDPRDAAKNAAISDAVKTNFQNYVGFANWLEPIKIAPRAPSNSSDTTVENGLSDSSENVALNTAVHDVVGATMRESGIPEDIIARIAFDR
jgi:hypothetical protein